MKVIETDKFTDVSISIRSIFPLDIKTITAFNLLPYVLIRTQHFSNKQDLIIFCDDVYDTRIGYSITAYGHQLVLHLKVQYIRSDWIPDDNYENKVKEIIDQMLNHAVIDQRTLDESKYLLKNRLLRQMDDPYSLTMNTAFTQIDTSSSIRIPVNGRIDDLTHITLDDILQLYAAYKNTSKHVYAVGCISEGMKNYLASIDDGKVLDADYDLLRADKVYRNKLSKAITQTSIGQVYSTSIAVDDTLYYPLLVMNSILGQSPNSLLFEEIREKHSYCYSIFSSLIRFDGALFIYTGTRKQYENDILDLIQVQIQKLCDGNFTKRQMDAAKKDLKDGLINGQDSAFSMIEQSFLDDIMHRSTGLNHHLQAIENVTDAEIQQAARNLHMVSCAIVEEENEEI